MSLLSFQCARFVGTVLRPVLPVVLSINFCGLHPVDAQVGTDAAALQDTKSDGSAKSSDTHFLQSGTVTVTVKSPGFSDRVDALISRAGNRNPDLERARAYFNRFASRKAAIGARTSDAVNSIFMFKGMSMSSQAGDVILDEKLKLNSLGAAKLITRKLEDQVELDVISRTLDLSAAVGEDPCSDRQSDIDEAIAKLEALSGKEAALGLFRSLDGCYSLPSHEMGTLSIKQKPSDLEKRVDLAVQIAALNDDIVEEIKADIHKYNSHGPAKMALHRIAQTTLCVISLTPNLIGPASQAVLFGYVVLTGGSETSKVLKEVYMGKRLEVRADTLKKEMHLLFDSYRLGVSTNNQVLMICAEQLLARRVGGDIAEKLLKEKDTSQVDQILEAKIKNAALAAKNSGRIANLSRSN